MHSSSNRIVFNSCSEMYIKEIVIPNDKRAKTSLVTETLVHSTFKNCLGHRDSSLDCRSLQRAFHPCLDPGEFVKRFEASELVNPDPGEDVEVGNRDLPTAWANEPVAISEPNLKHTVEPLSLVEVALLRIWNDLRCIPVEMVRLSLHRTYSTMREEDPLKHFTVFIGVCLGVESKLLVLVIVLCEVQEDSSGLEDDEIVAGSIDEHRDPTIWVQCDEPGFLLPVGGDIDLLDIVINVGVQRLQFLEEDGDLVTVGSRTGVE